MPLAGWSQGNFQQPEEDHQVVTLGVIAAMFLRWLCLQGLWQRLM